jgi:hypothetical protein
MLARNLELLNSKVYMIVKYRLLLQPGCIITQMRGNEYCGPGGVYECYGQTPKCKCPSGKGGERCQEDTKIDVSQCFWLFFLLFAHF